jgi:hypothetical protein
MKARISVLDPTDAARRAQLLTAFAPSGMFAVANKRMPNRPLPHFCAEKVRKSRAQAKFHLKFHHAHERPVNKGQNRPPTPFGEEKVKKMGRNSGRRQNRT